MLAAWGHPAAAVDLDSLYGAVDPLWELPYSDERNAMVLDQAVAWVRSLVQHVWRTVIVTGNSVSSDLDVDETLHALVSLVGRGAGLLGAWAAAPDDSAGIAVGLPRVLRPRPDRRGAPTPHHGAGPHDTRG